MFFIINPINNRVYNVIIGLVMQFCTIAKSILSLNFAVFGRIWFNTEDVLRCAIQTNVIKIYANFEDEYSK